jgi:ADP-ribose pyrophosphatase YjhB (NUDIX family)
VSAAVVDDRGRFLAIRRADNGHWEPPGGVLELAESIRDGLVREIEEETGVLVEPVALTGVYKNMTRGVVALVFRCRPLSRDATSGAEAAECRWLDAADVANLMTEAYAVRLLDALGDGPPLIRHHDGARVSTET